MIFSYNRFTSGKVVILASVISLSGCQAVQVMEENGINTRALGTTVGALTGALIGNQIGDGNGRLLATIGGAALGGWLGNRIADSLSKEEKESLALETGAVLDNTSDGETVEWKGKQSNTVVKITPSQTRQETRKTAVVKLKEVVSPPALSLINETYQANKNSNVRSGPSNDYPVVGGFISGEKFHAVGKVKTKPWIMVAKKGVTIGYIYQPLVSRFEEKSYQASVSKQKSNIREAIDLDEVADVDVTDLDNISLGGEVIELDLITEEIQVEGTCRTMSYDLDNSNSNKQESFKVCEGTDGAWEIS